MIESAVDVLTHPMLAKGVAAGLVVLVLGIVLASVRSEAGVQRYGGLMVAAATMLVLFQSNMVGRSQLAGIALLALAGLLPTGVAIGALVAIPGAFLVIRPEAADPQTWLPWFAMMVIVVAAPLVASFDDRHGKTGLSLPLFGIAALGVFLTVPDTEGALALLGVAGIAGFLGWPRPFASLGRSGAYAVIGVYMFVAAEGAIARPPSIIASAAVLGLLLVVPIAIRLRGTGRAHEVDHIDTVFPLIAHLLLVLLISRTAGRMPTVEAAAALTIALLAAATTIMLHRPSQLPQ